MIAIHFFFQCSCPIYNSYFPGMSCRILKRLDFKCSVASPLLDFVKELSENRASEVAGQTPRHIVFDEGFNHSLSEEENAGLALKKSDEYVEIPVNLQPLQI